MPFISIQHLDAQSYFYSTDHIQEVRLTIKKERWPHYLDSLKESDGGRLLVTGAVDGQVFDTLGVRYKGNSSYHAPQKSDQIKLPFNIKLDYDSSPDGLKEGFETLKLSNSFRDPSFLREVLAYEIARKYMPAPEATFAQLYINDDYQGLYQSVESIDKRFLRKYYGDSLGLLIKCDPIWNSVRPPDCPKGDGKSSLQYLGDDKACYVGLYEPKSEDVWDPLIDLTRILNKDPKKIESVLNVDQALWMLAFNNVIVNLDSYLGPFCHNYYLYQDTAGIFHPLIWDMNLAFGGFRSDGLGNVLSTPEMQELSMFLHYKQGNEKRPLVVRLLKQDFYRKLYLAHIRTLVEEVFLSGWFEERARALHQAMAEYVQEDANKLYDQLAYDQNLEQTVAAGSEEVVGLFELMDARVEYVMNHPVMQKPAPYIEEGRIEQVTDTELEITLQTEDADKAWLMCRPKGSTSLFNRKAMPDDGILPDQAEKDGIWTLVLPSHTDWEYYFIVENKYHARLLPEQAGGTYFTASDLLTQK